MKMLKKLSPLVIICALVLHACNPQHSQFNEDQVVADIQLTRDVIEDSAYRVGWDTYYVQWYEKDGERFTGTQTYYSDGQKMREMSHFSVTEDALGLIEEWHENGELKFHATLDRNNEYTGLMTLRDENGAVIKQEDY